MGVTSWVVVIPVKRLGAAKSRLRGAVADAHHEGLALAMLRDTIAAVAACPDVGDVLVVTDDPVVTAMAPGLDARPVPDAPSAGLNAAAAFGADVAAALHRWRAVLAGDLPALRPGELAAALATAAQGPAALGPAAQGPAAQGPAAQGPAAQGPAAQGPAAQGPAARGTAARGTATRGAAAYGGRHFLRDAAGTGTVLLTAGPGVPLDPHFGIGSAAAHAASGAVELSGDWPGLRHDVDTAADLSAALALGTGPHTSALLNEVDVTAGCRAG